MFLVVFILGFFFGLILLFAKLNRYDTISGLALLENYAVAKAIAVAIGVGIILLTLEISFGLASFHTKPFLLVGIILGGILFGSGMAILGYCPGTLPVSFGEGSIDALIGIIGGLFGGLFYTIILPFVKNMLGPNFGDITLFTLIGSENIAYYLLGLIIAVSLIVIAFWLHKIEKSKDLKWLYAGIGLAILNGIVFLNFSTDRIIGASTAYPYVSDYVSGTTGNSYFNTIDVPGNWELIFLFGAFTAGLFNSLRKKEFKFILIHDNWKKYKGNVPGKRIIWSFIGGFILIIGARMAGGCTSGHILSGGMQLAVSSFVFATFVFISLLITGKIFYKKF